MARIRREKGYDWLMKHDMNMKDMLSNWMEKSRRGRTQRLVREESRMKTRERTSEDGSLNGLLALHLPPIYS